MKYQSMALLAALSLALGSAAFAARPADQTRSQLPIKEFMGHVFQRNAEQVWGWTAEEVDVRGTHSSRPVTEQDWENAESDALSLAELTYALEGSVNRINAPDWRAHIARVREVANASAHAAEAHDYPALQKAGDDLNEACVSCHMRFAPQLESPPPSAS